MNAPKSSSLDSWSQLPAAEMNVTPLVDVMLVLLAIVMVCAPMMEQGIGVKLPKVSAGAPQKSSQTVRLRFNASKKIFLDRKSCDQKLLGNVLSQLQKKMPELQVLIEADESISYGEVAKLMGIVKKSGIEQVSLLMEPAER